MFFAELTKKYPELSPNTPSYLELFLESYTDKLSLIVIIHIGNNNYADSSLACLLLSQRGAYTYRAKLDHLTNRIPCLLILNLSGRQETVQECQGLPRQSIMFLVEPDKLDIKRHLHALF